MTDARFRPGPYHVIEGGNFIDISTHPASEDNHRTEGWAVAEITMRHPWRVTPQIRATARLLAKAPELYDALEFALTLVPTNTKDGERIRKVEAARDLLREVRRGPRR